MINVTKQIQLEEVVAEKKEINLKFAEMEAVRKEIADLIDESICLVQNTIDVMHQKGRTKRIENLWLVIEYLAKVDDLVEDNL